MFSINSRKSFSVTSLVGMDMHSHILPGIDDGAPDLETAVYLASEMATLGYRSLLATPHIMSDHYPNTADSIRAAASALKDALQERNVHVHVRYAAEYMMDAGFEELVRAGRLLTLSDDYVLVETMFMQPPPNWKTLLFDMQTSGYRPVLAHPERYRYIDKKLTKVEYLRDRGCLFQVNLLSFTGYYGKTEQQIAERMLDAGYVDFLGTDLHHDRHLKGLKGFSVTSKIARLLEKAELKNDTLAGVTKV